MENITFSKKKKGWLAGEEQNEQTEIMEELSSITIEQLITSCDTLIDITSSFYKKEKSKNIYDTIVQLESIRKSLNN